MRRRRIILAEFGAGLVVMVAFGVWVATAAKGPTFRALGFWLIGAGLNYGRFMRAPDRPEAAAGTG